MTIEDHNKYTAWLSKKDPYENYHVMKKSAFDLDGERINSYDAAIGSSANCMISDVAE